MKIYKNGKYLLVESQGERVQIDSEGRCSSHTLEVIPDAIDCGECLILLGILCTDSSNYLILVTQASIAGYYRSSESRVPINRIDRVKAIPLDVDDKCVKQMLDNASNGRLKTGTDKLLKFVQDRMNNGSAPIDEVIKIFTSGFYYCMERDLTHTTHSFFSGIHGSNENFFWNKHILEPFIKSNLSEESKKKWCVPIIQGFVRTVELSLQEDPSLSAVLELTLISRRSVKRAGTRYLRRGIDPNSSVANFVESELILNIFGHHLSFVQVRGSVPLFWSQKGFKYRPPLTIDKPMDESLPVFEKHIQSLSEHYGSNLSLVNLVDLTGRELKLAQAYLEHCVRQNVGPLTFFSFDLHHHCRGLRFDNISRLLEKMEDTLKSIGFCWVDKTGEIVLRQSGTVRVNCVDCLDRTNVVQGAISQYVCMKQAQRLGIFGPLAEPPDALISVLQTVWADNGDAISTQYAGTAALKGDVTRSGERKIAGIMKDGYNSASRYYLSHVKDTTRQRAINLLLGEQDQGSESMVEADSDSDEDDNVSRLVHETIHFLLPDGEIVVASWGLVDGKDGGDSVDTVVLLTRKSLLIAVYDEDAEKLLDFKIIPLDDLDHIEVGRPSKNARLHIRIVTKDHSQASWVWKPSKTRLFNNVALRLRSGEEADEYAESIAEQISVAYEMLFSYPLSIQHPSKLVCASTSGTAAKRAFATMTSALFVRTRKQTPASTNDQDSPRPIDSGLCTPQGDLDETNTPEVNKEELVNDKDKVVEKANTLVSRLRGIRNASESKLQEMASDPFEKLRDLFPKSLVTLVEF